MKIRVFAVLMFPEQANTVVGDLLRKGITVSPGVRGDAGGDTLTTERKPECPCCQLIFEAEKSSIDKPLVLTQEVEASLKLVKRYGAYVHTVAGGSATYRLNSTIEVPSVEPILAGPYRTAGSAGA